jgi:nitrogenase iron protein NifH
MAEHTESKIPKPLEIGELREWASKWGDYLLAVEQGKVTSAGDSI